jgi:hypothetical protein
MNLDIVDCKKINIKNIRIFIKDFYKNAKTIFNNNLVQDALKYKIINCDGNDIDMILKKALSFNNRQLINNSKYIYTIDSDINFYSLINILSYFNNTSINNQEKYKNIICIVNSITFISQDMSKSNLSFYVGFDSNILNCFDISIELLNSFINSIRDEFTRFQYVTNALIVKLNQDHNNSVISEFYNIDEFISSCIYFDSDEE